MDYKFFTVESAGKVAKILFNNEKNMNAMSWEFFEELPGLVDDIEKDKDIKVAIFYGKGEHFSIGLDVFNFAAKFSHILDGSSVEKRGEIYELIKLMQQGMNKIEKGNKVYIAGVHGYCIGGGLDFAAACDLRFASEDAVFSLRETKLGIIADLGSLQRLPNIIGIGHTKYLAYTGKNVDAEFAERIGLVENVLKSKKELVEFAEKVALEIAENPFDAVSGVKKFLRNLYMDKVDEQLERVALYNSSFLNFYKVAEKLEEQMRKRG